ncbi:MAG: tRNA 2-selenouridine(34) synthase MnmH [Flavobacteriales bacterium]|nr:tRNA 2-selenouridine(34) synthase MnmH [Flavobacteriales bacterium]
MMRLVDVSGFVAALNEVPGIDVRSPVEYCHGHIPGVHSLPLFSDEDRAVVGTLYKHEGRDAAVHEGLRRVGPRLADIVLAARDLAPLGRIAVHCWRGGERSRSVAWLLDKAGLQEVLVLRGGYKAFRHQVLQHFDLPLDLRVLGGYTGSGKTEVLHQLRGTGAQVIDLEALANHKGSSFGALGELPQPSSEHFENMLWHALQQLDPTRPVWVEDESLMIGRVRIPAPFFERMRNAPMFFLEIPIEKRADRLVAHYGHFLKNELAEAIRRIARRLGPQHCKAALEALDLGDMRTVALITLRYYDKAYARGSALRKAGSVTHVPARSADIRTLAAHIRSHERSPSR